MSPKVCGIRVPSCNSFAAGAPQFSWTTSGITTLIGNLLRHPAGCDFTAGVSVFDGNFNGGGNIFLVLPTSALETTDATAESGRVYYYAIVVIDAAVGTDSLVSNCVRIGTAGGGATDEAVLPNALRHQHRGITNGIFNRIRQRQQQDGRWQ